MAEEAVSSREVEAAVPSNHSKVKLEPLNFLMVETQIEVLKGRLQPTKNPLNGGKTSSLNASSLTDIRRFS